MFDRKAYMEDYNKRYYRDNIEREKKRSSVYSASPAGRARTKRFYLKNGAAYRERNREKIRERAREWARKDRAKNPEKTRIDSKKYYDSKAFAERKKTNSFKEGRRAANLKWIKKKYSTDMVFRLLAICRARIHAALRNTGTRKSERTETLIGCSSADLRKYLESKFLSGMTWENRGEWEIDHIRPCASFDLTIETERLKCFNFSNLQPLWKEDNRAKKDKYDGTMLR